MTAAIIDTPSRDAPSRDAPARDAPSRPLPRGDRSPGVPTRDAPARDAPALGALGRLVLASSASRTPTRGTAVSDAPARDVPLLASRTLVVWCPDWPAVAAASQAGLPTVGPAAVFHANRVRACTAAARAEGIRMGMRRRDAQSRCPELAVLPMDPDRDARLFEPVAAAVEAVAPGVEVLRPGLVACQIRGPARYFGSEAAAAERIVDAVESLDVECRIGIADVLPVAVLAARRSAIVRPGGDESFCAGLPLVELARDPAIAPPERTQLVDLLTRLGITTAGAFAALPAGKVAARFGADGVVMHRLASGRAERGLSRRRIDADLSVEQICDPPLDRVDTAAFAARALAERFHARLAGAGLACTRLAITATTEHGRSLTRIWRCARPLTAAATADRLRWQLDGWLTGRSRPAGSAPGVASDGGDHGAEPAGRAYHRELIGRTHGAERTGTPGADPAARADLAAPPRPGAITKLRLEPVEAVGAGLIQYGLWGSDGRDEHRAGWAFARVQGLLGPEAVLAPVLSGGRGPGDRVTLVAWGEEKSPERDPVAPWPGALPSPAPAARSGAQNDAVTVSDPAGRTVTVTGRGMLTGPPAAVAGDPVLSWAGPWLLDERWWSGPVTAPADRRARMQVVTGGGPPVLLGFGTGGWQIEAVYD